MDLRLQRVGLFLDVDGTLLDLAPKPDAVEVPAGLLDTLVAAERCLDGALALVSGRPIRELDRLFTPLRLRASGIHGAEIRQAADGPSTCLSQARLPERAWRDLRQLLSRFPGAFAENKGVAFAVHFRFGGADEQRFIAALHGLVEAISGFELELSVGHSVVEIRPSGLDKGTAIKRFMARAPFADRQPVFVGDDVMDHAGFDAALELGGFAFSVGRSMPGLSGWFTQPAAVRAWLEQFAR